MLAIGSDLTFHQCVDHFSLQQYCVARSGVLTPLAASRKRQSDILSYAVIFSPRHDVHHDPANRRDAIFQPMLLPEISLLFLNAIDLKCAFNNYIHEFKSTYFLNLNCNFTDKNQRISLGSSS